MDSGDNQASTSPTPSIASPAPSTQGNGERHANDGEWRCIPTSNPLKSRLAKVVGEEHHNKLSVSFQADQPRRDSGAPACVIHASATSSLTTAHTSASETTASSSSTKPRQRVHTGQVLDEIDRYNRLVLAKSRTFRMCK